MHAALRYAPPTLLRALVLVLAVLALPARALAGDPTRAWRTVETAHFVIYYWAPLDDVARRVGVTAERAHRVLSPRLDHVPTTKTLIFLSDDTDDANGFAAVLPRNQIQLYATGPESLSDLDDHDDWLYGLVAHEYTHILHLDTMSGLPVIYNAIFGKTWSPSQIMPRWLIEGIAVYEESKRSAGGRNRGTRFDQYIRIARHAKPSTLLRLDEVSGDPRQFPRGNAVYVYGSHFLQYVFDRFGDDALRQMTHLSGAFPVPFAVNRQIAKVVGKPFTELYDDWTKYLRDRYGMQEMALARSGVITGRAVTHTAEANYLAHYSHDGKELYWLEYTGYALAKVRAMPVGGDQKDARDVVQLDALGPFDVLPDGSLVYEQTRQFRLVYSFEDLFRWDARTGDTVRLTRGGRTRDPAVSPDGRRVAFSMNVRSESVLAVMDLAPDAQPSIAWRGERFDQAYQPAWSPDGTRIAFSAWRKGGYRDILVVELASGHVQELTHDRALDMSPKFSRDGRWVYFDSDRTGIANIYAYDLASGELWQVTNVIGGAYRCDVSPDGTRVAFEAAAPKGGYDLFEVAIDRSTWLPARPFVDDKPPPADIRDDEVAVTAPRPYRALETLAPQAWTLSLDTSGAAPTASIQTGGADAVGLHGYSLAIAEDLQHGDTNVGASYGYGGLRPSLNIAAARTLLVRGGWRVDGVAKTFQEEDWSGTFAVGLPLESRPNSSWTLSFDYNGDWFRLVKPPAGATTLDPNQRISTHPITDYVEAGVGARLAFSNVRSTVFALGASYGFDASTSLRLDDPAFGSSYRAITVSYGLDAYERLGSVRSVLAERLVGAWRAGDLVRPGGFALGGVPPQDVAMSIVNSTRSSPIGYLRGFKPRTVTGNQYHLLNVEYRRELFLIEHGLATLPIYFRRVHVALLSDAGTAFDTTFVASRDLRVSAGAALRLDAFFGYFVPGTFEIGYARGLYGADAINETWFLLTGSL